MTSTKIPLISDAIEADSKTAAPVYTPDDVFLTTAEVAAETGYTIEYIRDACADGRLRAFQPSKGAKIRIPRSAVREWLGRPAARRFKEGADLEDTDWTIPAEGTETSSGHNNLIICDEGTLFIPVAVQNLSRFMEAKVKAGR